MNDMERCFRAVAENVKKVRLTYGLTQKQMAEKLGVDYQYYARIEGGKGSRKFTLEKVMLVCALFNMTPNEIISKLPDVSDDTNDRNIIEGHLVNELDRMSFAELADVYDFICKNPKFNQARNRY